MKHVILLLAAVLLQTMALAQTPVELADAQLLAYNNRDIEAFLVPYSDSVKIYNDKRALIYEGKEQMRDQYGKFFKATPSLHCDLRNRIAVGNTVIEHEEVSFGENRRALAIVMYKVRNNKIQEVHFLDDERL